MKKFFSFFLLIFCSQSHALINSELAPKEQMPAAMQIWSMQGNQLQFRCSGTLIAPDVVITEASCIYDKNNQRRQGTFLISNSTKTDFSNPLSDILQRVLATVKMDTRHPQENIVLLYLNQAIPIKPAVLLQSDESYQLMYPGISFVAGWGFNQVQSKHPFMTTITNWILNRHEVRQSNTKHLGKTHIGSLTDHTIEFGYEPQDALGCIGDEGGPIIINIQTSFINTERLVGIISSSNNLLQCNSPSYGLRLDTLSSFINEQLTWACKKGYRAWCDIQGLLPPGFDEDDTPEIISFKPNPPPSPAAFDEPQKRNTEIPKMPQGKTFTENKEQTSFRKNNPSKNLKIKMESMGCHCMKIRSR